MASSFPHKLIAQVPFKGGGDLFHKLLRFNPLHFCNATPTYIQAFEVLQGHCGVNGSTVQWKYSVDGKPQTVKQVVQDVDEEKKQIAFKLIEGDLLELYKNVLITVHVETKGGIDFNTYTIDYELISADNPHPLSLLDFFIGLTKQLEAHIFG